MLSLSDTGITHLGLPCLAEALAINQTLKVIRCVCIRLNRLLCLLTYIIHFVRLGKTNLQASDCHIIAQILKTHKSLDLIEYVNAVLREGYTCVLSSSN